MDLILGNLIPFLAMLSVLVFVHEFGHYWVARRCGVGVHVFSVGFGPEIFGFTDGHGTRWKFSLIPLGGYVKMVGDANEASVPGEVDELPPDLVDQALQSKSVGQRAAVVAAGPIANFLLAFVLLVGLYVTIGNPFPGTRVGSVMPDSPALAAGVAEGDRILAVDGERVIRFAGLAPLINRGQGEAVELSIDRSGGETTLLVVPEAFRPDPENHPDVVLYRIGIGAEADRVGPFTASITAVRETWFVIRETGIAIGEIVVGDRGTEDLGGPIRIAVLSGQAADVGLGFFIWVAAMLSINLGLINLLPVPILDGGHLLFYAIEAIRGRPLSDRAQEVGFRIGFAFVVSLMVFVTWNDLAQLNVFGWLQGVFS